MKSKSWDGDDRELGPLRKLHDGKEKPAFARAKFLMHQKNKKAPHKKLDLTRKYQKGLMKENENKRAPRQQQGVRADTTHGLCWDQLQVFADHRITFHAQNASYTFSKIHPWDTNES